MLIVTHRVGSMRRGQRTFQPDNKEDRHVGRVSNVRPYVCVRTYVRPCTTGFFDFNEIWHVGRGRWVMHDGMQYDPIQGHGQGHEPLEI